MFKNAVIFRLKSEHKLPATFELEEQLKKEMFTPCGATQLESFGWTPPRGEPNGPLLENVGGQYILQLLTEAKVLPASVVKDALKKRLAKAEHDTGRKPKGKWAKELKEEVILDLLPKAFTKTSSTRVWLDPKGLVLVVEAGSVKKCERIVSAVLNAVMGCTSGVSLHALNTQASPAVAMANWLTTQVPPEDFSIDRDLELKGVGEDKATVRYSHHTLDIREVVDHIKAGKTPTKLALTHNDRVSFVLADNLTLKKIEILDVVLDDSGGDAGFDTDVAIFTGEMTSLIPALIKALDGEADSDVQSAPAKESDED